MRILLAIALVALLLSGAPLPSSSRAEEDSQLDIIVHSGAPVTRMSAHEVEAVFTRTQTRWGDGSPVHPFSFPTASETRQLFDRVALRLGPEEVGRFWLDRRIRGLGMPPRQVPTAALMVQVIASLVGSIGYAPSGRSSEGVRVVARIAHGKVVPP
jgi:hypothetical protein